MKILFFGAFLFVFLTRIYATGPENADCLGKEKSLALIETLEILYTKAKNTFPTCKEDVNFKNWSECGGQKSLSYIELSKKLVSDLRKSIPTCAKPDKDKPDKDKPDKDKPDKDKPDKDKPDKDKPDEKDDKVVKEKKFRNCAEILDSGRRDSGVYTIWPEDPFKTGKSLQVYCDMQSDMGGWAVIQRRGKYPFQVDFRKNWEGYKNGFGNIREEFWLGNENILALCHKGCELRIDLEDWTGARRFGNYDNFRLEGRNYRLSVNGFTGNIVGLLHYSDGRDFSTKDRGDTQMANYMKSGWWHVGGGYYVNLNGLYQPGQSNLETVHWYDNKNLASVEMKVRPK